MKRIPVTIAILVVCCAGAGAPLSGSLPPSLENRGGQHHLLVDGRPFVVLGGQVHNSSTADEGRLERAFVALEKVRANTAFVPVYWELLEPCEGRFDFALVDRAVRMARAHRLRLVLLWFGAWKNGEMRYAPEWVKRDKARFPRVCGARGEELTILSPLTDATRAADAAAFRAMMGRVRQLDESERTVILVQVENEAGFLGADRDYSTAGTRYFEGPVPPELTAHLEAHRAALSAPLAKVWGENGNRASGTWTEVFGGMAAEVCTGWNIARYVDAVAAAGLEEYALPMYANAWLANGGGERAGAWPSGGPNEHMLDVWKCAAPHLAFLAPDVYYPAFSDVCATFRRPDNALFIPEVNFEPYYAAFAFTAFAGFDALAYSAFGIDDVFEEPGAEEVAPIAIQLARVYGILNPLLPLIAERRHTGTMYPVVQCAGEWEDTAPVIRLGDELAAKVTYTVSFDVEKERGAGMIVKLARDEFFVAGFGFDLVFRELSGPPRDAEIVSIDEGTFLDGEWIQQCRLNGDEQQVSLTEPGRILRVKLLR